MIRPFGIGDVLLVNKLQKKGTRLGLEGALTRPYSPLSATLTAFLPSQAGGVSTFVCDGVERGRRLLGFAQMRERPGRPEGEVLYLSPALSSDEDASLIWARLLAYMCANAGERGLQRVFAATVEPGDEIGIFRQVGFTIYTREDVFRLERSPNHSPAASDASIRPRQARDNLGIKRLHAAIAPRLVQQAEDPTQEQESDWLNGWLTGDKDREYVLEEDAEITGYLRVSRGSAGHWLRILLHPNSYDRAEALIEHGLAAVRESTSTPVYCSVREYQGGLRVPLEEKGFQPFARQALLVKHTTVWVKEPLKKLVPVLEKRVEVSTPTVSPANGG